MLGIKSQSIKLLKPQEARVILLSAGFVTILKDKSARVCVKPFGTFSHQNARLQTSPDMQLKTVYS